MHHFFHPEPKRGAESVFPVFLPFAGCAGRCIYCAQSIQTGQAPAPLANLLAAAKKDLCAMPNPPQELAFYGGTFTALPQEDLERCLDFARDLLATGRIQRFRCSTRPDAVNLEVLEQLKQAGCTLVELGVQSFSDAALRASGRGYSGDTAKSACRMVTEAGLGLGIQLMPGLPGYGAGEAVEDMPAASVESAPASILRAALADAATAAALHPTYARLYPCVVFAGSPLARLWDAGRYTPLEHDETIEILAQSCLLLWRVGARVIRMGLAEPDRLREHVLAGPLHPALGNLARIRALFLLVAQEAAHMRKLTDKSLILRVPRQRQGEAFAPSGSNLAPYADLGIVRVETHEAADFLLLPA